MDLRKSAGLDGEDTIVLNDSIAEKHRIMKRSKDAEAKHVKKKKRNSSAGDDESDQTASKTGKKRANNSMS